MRPGKSSIMNGIDHCRVGKSSGHEKTNRVSPTESLLWKEGTQTARRRAPNSNQIGNMENQFKDQSEITQSVLSTPTEMRTAPISDKRQINTFRTHILANQMRQVSCGKSSDSSQPLVELPSSSHLDRCLIILQIPLPGIFSTRPTVKNEKDPKIDEASNKVNGPDIRLAALQPVTCSFERIHCAVRALCAGDGNGTPFLKGSVFNEGQ